MDDLTPAQRNELHADLAEFVQNRALDGLQVLVILRGRGFDNIAFPDGTSKVAEHLAIRAVLSLRKAREQEAT